MELLRKVYWGMPINVTWHRLIQAIMLRHEDEAYFLTRELVRQSLRIGNRY